MLVLGGEGIIQLVIDVNDIKKKAAIISGKDSNPNATQRLKHRSTLKIKVENYEPTNSTLTKIP